MNVHFKNWLDGVKQALVLYPEQDYYLPQRGDFSKDTASLRSDATKVGKGLRNNVTKNGKINPRLR